VLWRIIRSAARSLDQDFGTCGQISVRLGCVEMEFQIHSKPIACQGRVQGNVFLIRTIELLRDDVVQETGPSPARGRAEVQGCTCQRKDKLAYPEYPQYTPMSLKHVVNFFSHG
jgi:hypothetical protein